MLHVYLLWLLHTPVVFLILYPLPMPYVPPSPLKIFGFMSSYLMMLFCIPLTFSTHMQREKGKEDTNGAQNSPSKTGLPSPITEPSIPEESPLPDLHPCDASK